MQYVRNAPSVAPHGRSDSRRLPRTVGGGLPVDVRPGRRVPRAICRRAGSLVPGSSEAGARVSPEIGPRSAICRDGWGRWMPGLWNGPPWGPDQPDRVQSSGRPAGAAAAVGDGAAWRWQHCCHSPSANGGVSPNLSLEGAMGPDRRGCHRPRCAHLPADRCSPTRASHPVCWQPFAVSNPHSSDDRQVSRWWDARHRASRLDFRRDAACASRRGTAVAAGVVADHRDPLAARRSAPHGRRMRGGQLRTSDPAAPRGRSERAE